MFHAYSSICAYVYAYINSHIFNTYSEYIFHYVASEVIRHRDPMKESCPGRVCRCLAVACCDRDTDLQADAPQEYCWNCPVVFMCGV